MASFGFWQWIGIYLLTGAMLALIAQLSLEFSRRFMDSDEMHFFAPDEARNANRAASEAGRLFERKSVLLLIILIWPIAVGYFVYYSIKGRDKKPVA